MKKTHLVTAMLLCLVICTACAAETAQPYQEYQAAWQLLREADNFAVERTDALLTGGNGIEENTTDMISTYHLAGSMFTAQHILDTEAVINQYFRNGQLFSQNITNPQENYRTPKTDDFARASALEGIIDFPADVIASQNADDTAEGRLLTFEMDSAKYYEYRFPPDTNDGYRYGEFQSYREPPQYTVLLDEQGRIIRVNGSFCTVNADEGAFTWQQSYTINISQYGEIQLDFPELNEADYPLLGESPIIIPEGATSLKDDNAMELFTDESQWAMPDLLQAEVYLLDGEMNIDFWFNNSADDHQINNARSFAITTFVLRKAGFIGQSPYRDVLFGRDATVEWQTASCRVYRGQELLYHERYDEKNQLIKP